MNYQPLRWPPGWARVPDPGQAQFHVDFWVAAFHLEHELELLGATLPILTLDSLFTNSGKPRAGRHLTGPAPGVDPGVALYFQVDEEAKVMACDRWNSIKDNVRAIGLTVAALRGIERWGGLNLMDRAFEGFAALPGADSWWQVLGIGPMSTDEEIRRARNEMAKKYHPDTGSGDEELMKRVNLAFEQAMTR